MARDLYLCFTSIVRNISQQVGIISAAEFDTGVFYLGVRREYVFQPTGKINEFKCFFRLGKKASEVHALLKKVFEKAEQQGRLFWAPNGSRRSYEKLNELLGHNGLPQLNITGGDFFDKFVVRRYVQEGVLGEELRVIV